MDRGSVFLFSSSFFLVFDRFFFLLLLDLLQLVGVTVFFLSCEFQFGTVGGRIGVIRGFGTENYLSPLLFFQKILTIRTIS